MGLESFRRSVERLVALPTAGCGSVPDRSCTHERKTDDAKQTDSLGLKGDTDTVQIQMF